MTAALAGTDTAMVAVLLDRVEQLSAKLDAMASTLGLSNRAPTETAPAIAPERPREWNGRRANALRTALRMSQERFAAKLGISRRSVTDWGCVPDRVPRYEIQQLLDIAWTWADGAALDRYRHLVSDTDHPDRTAPAAVRA